MTRHKALKLAKERWGKRAAVQSLPNGARIGFHGEFVESHFVSNKKDSPKCSRYICRRCSTADVDAETGDYIVRDVWHFAGGLQMSCRVGYIDTIIGAFNIVAEGATFEEAFAKHDAKKGRAA